MILVVVKAKCGPVTLFFGVSKPLRSVGVPSCRESSDCLANVLVGANFTRSHIYSIISARKILFKMESFACMRGDVVGVVDHTLKFFPLCPHRLHLLQGEDEPWVLVAVLFMLWCEMLL